MQAKQEELQAESKDFRKNKHSKQVHLNNVNTTKTILGTSFVHPLSMVHLGSTIINNKKSNNHSNNVDDDDDDNLLSYN